MGRKTKQMKILIKLLLLTSITTFAQHKTVEVDYTIKRTLAYNVATEYDGNLKYNDSCSVFFFDAESQRAANENGALNDLVVLAKPGPKPKDFGDFTFFNIKDNFINFTRNNDEKGYVVKDTTPKLNWNIKTEEKTIAGYNCSRAEVYFRGRNYIAWFTTALPNSFGPWKFNGLPGLILEVYDTELLFTWQAKKIKTISKELKIPKFNYKIVSMKDSEKLYADFVLERSQIRQSKLPPGVKISKTQKGSLMETKFEWEEKQSK
jgi:GLPGLI family protein